jgi:hypothetical protein
VIKAPGAPGATVLPSSVTVIPNPVVVLVGLGVSGLGAPGHTTRVTCHLCARTRVLAIYPDRIDRGGLCDGEGPFGSLVPL